jgi:hypothetical protein
MATYKLIASTTLSSTTASISFTGIPSTYTDLVLVAALKSNQVSGSDGAYALLELNNAGTTNTGGRFLYGFTASDTGYSAPNYVLGWGSGSDTGFSATHYYLYNYATSDDKVIGVNSWQEGTIGAGIRNGITAGFYNNSAAISSVKINNALGSYVSGSSAYLYGISKA